MVKTKLTVNHSNVKGQKECPCAHAIKYRDSKTKRCRYSQSVSDRKKACARKGKDWMLTCDGCVKSQHRPLSERKCKCSHKKRDSKTGRCRYIKSLSQRRKIGERVKGEYGWVQDCSADGYTRRMKPCKCDLQKRSSKGRCVYKNSLKERRHMGCNRGEYLTCNGCVRKQKR